MIGEGITPIYSKKKKTAIIIGTYLPDVNNAPKSVFVHELNVEEQGRFYKRKERLKHRVNISYNVYWEIQ